MACLIGAVLPAFTFGCATQYGAPGITGGVESKMIGAGEGIVVVAGNGFTPAARVEQMMMLRSAELTLQAGHQRFSLLSIEDQGALDALNAGQLLNTYGRRQLAVTWGRRLVLPRHWSLEPTRAR